MYSKNAIIKWNAEMLCCIIIHLFLTVCDWRYLLWKIQRDVSVMVIIFIICYIFIFIFIMIMFLSLKVKSVFHSSPRLFSHFHLLPPSLPTIVLEFLRWKKKRQKKGKKKKIQIYTAIKQLLPSLDHTIAKYPIS